MRAQSIRAHLRTYSIYQRRKTTINHAFASALAPSSQYSLAAMEEALSALGQSADGELHCVFCESEAQTWDHLTGLAKDSELAGFGHQLGNLVPCCRSCNSRKGSKDWRRFVSEEVAEPKRAKLIKMLGDYQERFAAPVDLAHARTLAPETWTQYDAIRAEILRLMQTADEIASELRKTIATRAV